VVLAVARRGNISSIDLVSPCREQDLVVWRLVLYGLCRELTYASYGKIARILGDRHHSTIMKGLTRLKELRAKDPAIDAAYISLSQELSRV
jgi:chromosomal replication initiator protein